MVWIYTLLQLMSTLEKSGEFDDQDKYSLGIILWKYFQPRYKKLKKIETFGEDAKPSFEFLIICILRVFFAHFSLSAG